jgi:hypothetical protein
MEIDAAIAALLGAGISGFFSTVTTIWVLKASKRSEERRHLRDLIVRTAVENWKAGDEAAKLAREPRLPLDVYIIHMLKFADLLTKPNLTAEDVRRNVVDEAIRLAEGATERMRRPTSQQQ